MAGFVVGLYVIGWPIWKLGCHAGDDICASGAGVLGALIGGAIGLVLGIWLGG
ncbi:MAG: hypothetical protein ACXVDS_08255 [Actinomycetota bacterium]